MSKSPEYIDVEVPYCIGIDGSFQCWGMADKGVCKADGVDVGVMSDGIPDDEYRKSGVRYGRIKVRVPIAAAFRDLQVEGEACTGAEKQ